MQEDFLHVRPNISINCLSVEHNVKILTPCVGRMYPTRVGSMLPTKEHVYTYIVKMACKVHLLQDIFLSATNLVSYLIRRMLFYHGSSIDGPYLEGVSVTHGQSPRKHIWSFANGLLEAYGYDSNHHICPCRPNSTMQQYIPGFVGNDYFCDTGLAQGTPRTGIFYSDDPLWDGQGCDLQPDCCNVHSPPWFCKTLNSTNDNIEVRICADEEAYVNEDSPIELVELYIQ